MANLNIPNSHVDGTVADADDVNANNQAVEDYINDRNDGTEAWDNLKVKETGGNNTITLAVGTHAADRTYTIIDAGAAADVVVTEAAQTINGAKTFTDPITQTDTTNQLVLGTTRTVTVNAPTPASTSRVITLPDLSGDYSVVGTIAAQTIAGVKTFSSSPLVPAATTATQAVAFSQLKILQVVTSQNTTAFTTTSSTYQTSNCSVAITPSATTSKIFVIASGHLRSNAVQTSNANASIFRDTTNLGLANVIMAFYSANGALTGNGSVPVTMHVLDSPATTSAITYSVKVKNDNNSTTVGFGNDIFTSITAFEVNGI